MPSVTDVRTQFLEFFQGKDHQILPSSSLVPQNDPTLMFANAGMNQFKNIFTGMEKPPQPPRAATSQKCVRAGGKHNDLDNVGYTARHHTFFEMLGNFSFGDYFKEGAISYAWELVTKVWGINPEKLCVTVYHTDDEAFNLWKKIAGLPDERIIRIANDDNFWAMGDTGPCGPCSEIFYDHGAHIPGGPPGSPDQDGDRFVEIWNLVFMQYDQKDKDTRVPLPKPCIDTGMGLERVAAVLQGVPNNYDIDLFKNIIAASMEVTHNNNPEQIASHRVIADHLRATSFLIADGVLPSNEGRGYVLRRIMRRAMRHAHLLRPNSSQPLMYQLVPTLVTEMGAAYPELKRAQPVIQETLKLEEERFKQLLDRGLKLLEEEKAKLTSLPPLAGGAGGGSTGHISNAEQVTRAPSPNPSRKQEGDIVFPGDVAFKLYDTYGFPLDLTQDILRGENVTVDTVGFNAAMNEQRERARAAHKGSGDAATSAVWFDIKERHGATEFLGYSMDHAEALITALVKDGKEVSELKAGEKGQLVANQTPFYGESGGQVGDSGSVTAKGGKASVTDTSKPLDGLHVHAITVESGSLKTGDTIDLVIDTKRRDRIRANHSATHLLHAALRHKLGEHVSQKGSLVADDKLRFDFTQPKGMTREEIDAVEAEVNRHIAEDTEASTRLMGQQEAIAAGAMALFGEKYGDEVRVLAMGNHGDANFSVELCGGTHVRRTGDIGLFKVTSEGSVSSGVRRIEGVTGEGVRSFIIEQLEKLDAQLKSLNEENQRLAGQLTQKPTPAAPIDINHFRTIALAELNTQFKTETDHARANIERLQETNKKLAKEADLARKAAAMGDAGEATVETIGTTKLASQLFPDLDAKSLRDLANAAVQKHADAVNVLLSASEGKANIIIAIGKQAKGDAPTLVKAAVEAVGGKGGGGRPDFAQGGGPEGDKLEAALAAVKAALA